MKHLQSDYEAIVKTIKENDLDSEDDIRGLHLEVIEFVMAFVAELKKRDQQISRLNELVSEMGEDVDELLDGLSKNYLDFETGSRVMANLQSGMHLLATLVKIIEDKVEIDDIKKQQIRANVEPHLQDTVNLLAELETIIDTEEDEDDDGTPDDDGDDGDGDAGDSDGDDGRSGDGDEDEEEGEAKEGA